jgi:L,D-peptidoglycan transpeptidase YkuD (ErfK/YbiS/YcfS/YnhG family)
MAAGPWADAGTHRVQRLLHLPARGCTRDENLWKNRRVAYRHAAVIDFNYRRPVWGRGSGIFLHQQTGGPTAGCVSLRQTDLVAVLRWLRPGTRIVMGPASFVRGL